jgi:hypothetical protein
MEKIDQFLEDRRARVVLFILVSMLVVAPTYFLGVYDGPDIPQHFQFADTFERAIRSGDFYPAWAAHENLGYGSVGPRFYPPLFSFVLALAHILINNWHLAICLVFFFFSFVGTVGTYLLAKEFLKPCRAFWAGIAFSLMPYHLNQIYSISVYAEFAGCSALAFCFLFATRVCRRGTLGDVIGLASSYAILILTHLPSSVTGSLCLLIYGIIMISKGRTLSTLLKLGIASILGLLASLVYWLKMVTELSWMQHTTFHQERVFDYKYNFLLTGNFLDGAPYPFLTVVLIVTVLMIGFALWGLYASGELALLKRLRGLIALSSISIFMVLPISQPIWEVFPFIQTIQFPFRWLTITTASGSIIIASSIYSLYNYAKQSPDHLQLIKLATGVLATGMVLIFSVTWMSASYSFPASTFDQWVDNKISSKGLDFWWTVITKKEAFNIKEKVVTNDRQTTISDWQPYERDFIVEAGNGTNARVATLFYPRWQAEVNGSPVELTPDENGAILVPIPDGKATVRVWFQETVPVRIAFWVSGITWLLMFSALVFIWLGLSVRFGTRSRLLAEDEFS